MAGNAYEIPEPPSSFDVEGASEGKERKKDLTMNLEGQIAFTVLYLEIVTEMAGIIQFCRSLLELGTFVFSLGKARDSGCDNLTEKLFITITINKPPPFAPHRCHFEAYLRLQYLIGSTLPHHGRKGGCLRAGSQARVHLSNTSP